MKLVGMRSEIMSLIYIQKKAEVLKSDLPSKASAVHDIDIAIGYYSTYDEYDLEDLQMINKMNRSFFKMINESMGNTMMAKSFPKHQ